MTEEQVADIVASIDALTYTFQVLGVLFAFDVGMRTRRFLWFLKGKRLWTASTSTPRPASL